LFGRTVTHAAVLLAVGCGASTLRRSAGAPDGGPDAGVDAGPDLDGGDAGADAGSGVDGGTCRLFVDAGSPFGMDVMVSDPASPSFAPTIAAGQDTAIVAFHELTDGGDTQIAYSVIVDGCVGPLSVVPESLRGPKLPQAAATSNGFTLVYEATQGALTVVRRVDLGLDGSVLEPPTTLTTAGASGEEPHVAAAGDDLAFAWTDGQAFFFARSGPSETLAAFPRIALGSDGTTFIGYCDGSGGDESGWDALLLIRPPGGAFAAPVDLSNDPGLFDDGLALAVEPTGVVDIAWVAQDSQDVNDADVVHVSRDATGMVSAPIAYASQGSQAWLPAVVPGPLVIWTLGSAPWGPLYLAGGSLSLSPVLPAATAEMPALALDSVGGRHLVFQVPGTVEQIHYARGP